VRRERKGGKSAEKQGVVTIDLTMFASSSEAVEKRYLLQAGSNFNSKKQGKDNSVLQISVSMHQQEGAPVYVDTGALLSLFTCFVVVCAPVYVDTGALLSLFTCFVVVCAPVYVDTGA
jgi:hypothetical protein